MAKSANLFTIKGKRSGEKLVYRAGADKEGLHLSIIVYLPDTKTGETYCFIISDNLILVTASLGDGRDLVITENGYTIAIFFLGDAVRFSICDTIYADFDRQSVQSLFKSLNSSPYED